MRGHHTKDKGDIGVAHAIADLADQGFLVLMPFCEHARSISLRVEPTRNGQQRNVLSADAFTKVPANLLAPTD